MRALLWLSVIMVGWIGACSSISVRQTLDSFPVPQVRLDNFDSKDPVAVDAWLEKKYLAQPTEPMRHLVRYRQAALWSPIDPVKACTLWGEVTGSKLFPLRNVAQVRALETCPPGHDSNDKSKSLTESTPETAQEKIKEPWLRENLLRALLSRAEVSGEKKLEMSLSFELAPSEKVQRDRIRRLERTIELATELGDETAKKDAEDRLRQLAPRFIPEPAQNQWLQVANDFRQAREFEKARETYTRIFESKETNDYEKLRALDGIRQTYKLEKNTAAFLNATKEFSTFARSRFFDAAKGPQAKQLLAKYLETQITLARAVWTENGPSEAAAILKKAEKEIKGRIPVTESVLIRARIEEEAGHFKDVAKLLEPIDLKTVSERSTRQKILWYRAWNLRRIGQMQDAIASLERLLTEDDTPSQIARDRFWLGKSLISIGENERAATHFEWLIANDPLGYYGLLSYRELKRPLPALDKADLREPATDQAVPPIASDLTAQQASTPAQQTSALAPLEKLTAEWLIAVGENELARRFLDYVSTGLRTSLDEPKALDLLHLYARAGSYQSLFARLSELAPDVRARVLADQPELLFPRPWFALVKESAEKFSVRQELMYSIMRQESSFNPLARSPADAFGLMQLIPEAAKHAAKIADVPYKSPEDLYEPAIIIPLGAAFLQDLLKGNKDSFILTVASYNASEKAIRGWLKTRFRGDTLEFIEDIPYEETRTYIKLVMRNFVFYSRLNAGQSQIEFPEWCLSGLHDANP